jgi:anthranilate phosphoribosyltransferase
VGRPELLELMSGALARLGTARALVVYSRDGLDEVSLSAPTMVREVCGSEVRALEWTPDTFGLEEVARSDLAAADAEDSAAVIERVLDGADVPATRVVLANAAAALLAAEAAQNPAHGVALARTAIRTGAAKRVLERLRTTARN